MPLPSASDWECVLPYPVSLCLAVAQAEQRGTYDPHEGTWGSGGSKYFTRYSATAINITILPGHHVVLTNCNSEFPAWEIPPDYGGVRIWRNNIAIVAGNRSLEVKLLAFGETLFTDITNCDEATLVESAHYPLMLCPHNQGDTACTYQLWLFYVPSLLGLALVWLRVAKYCGCCDLWGAVREFTNGVAWWLRARLLRFCQRRHRTSIWKTDVRLDSRLSKQDTSRLELLVDDSDCEGSDGETEGSLGQSCTTGERTALVKGQRDSSKMYTETTGDASVEQEKRSAALHWDAFLTEEVNESRVNSKHSLHQNGEDNSTSENRTVGDNTQNDQLYFYGEDSIYSREFKHIELL